MADAIRFLHGSDFHLDCPISGLAEIPSHIKSTLANAPYEAAENFFDTAIAEAVDFVLLSGDIANLDRGGPRAAAFLLNQFERLDAKDIDVYWCAGDTDQPDRWPTSIELPDNVTTFCGSVVERVPVQRKGRTIATIFGCGYEGKKRVPGEFRPEDGDVFPIALAYGQLEDNNLAIHKVRYWAMGGKHKRSVIDKSTAVAVYPGTIQSRKPNESGSHSCTLCRVDLQGNLQLTAFDIDRVRWVQQSLAVAETINTNDLQDLAVDRAQKIAAESPKQLVLVNWVLNPTGEFNTGLHSEAFHAEFLNFLRTELGQDGSQGVWTANLEVKSPNALPHSWYEEDTILGDYLRSVARYNGDDSIPLGLQELIPANIDEDSLAGIARVSKFERERILSEAALVGVEYLCSHDSSDNED